MFGKTPVTALEEYCAKKNVEKPVYEYINSEMDKSFICRVSIFSQNADGIGRSKKEAKHDAAANMIKRLKYSHPDIEDIPQAPHETISTTDAIAGLRDLCLQYDYPLPKFEIVQRTGPPEAPEFTAECSVATIIRYAVASTKKAAKQKAAQQIIEIFKTFNLNEIEKQIVPLDDFMEDENTKNASRIKTYREYIESDIKVEPGCLLSERHNYFKKFDSDIKAEAISALNDISLLSDADRVHQFLQKLGIKYKKSTVPVEASQEMIFIELYCEGYDCVFAETNDQIWPHMLGYFKDMML